MRLLLRGTVVVAALFLLVIGVVVARTVTFKPPGADQTPVALQAGATVDPMSAARHLGEAIRFQTVSHQNAAENDPRAWSDLHEWMATTYPRLHAAARREDVGGAGLIWTWPGSDSALQPIVLMAHQDVVPVASETLGLWRAPPFSGEVRDGAVWGRGSIDDKGSLIATLEAAEALAASGFKPRRTVIIVSGQDEEAGGTGAQAAAALLKARGVRAAFVLDEGSVVVADNPVTHGPAALIGVAEKGYATLRLTAKATGGHSSAPPKSTAVAELARAVLAVADHPAPLRYGGPAADMLQALSPAMSFGSRMAIANAWLFSPVLKAQFGATPQGAAMLHTTTAPTMLEGSPKENVLPDRAIARINFRISPGDTAAAVMARARASIGRRSAVELSWEGAARDPSPVSSTRAEGWRLLRAAALESAPGAPVAPSLVIAATDSRNLVGVADGVYRFQPIVLKLRDTEMIHGVDEHLTIDNLGRMLRFYGALIRTGAG